MSTSMTKGERRELELLTQGPQPAYRGHGNRGRSGVQNRLVLKHGWARYLPTATAAETVEITESGRAAFGGANGDGSEAKLAKPKMFFLQNTRNYVGNSVLWWCPGGAGYTPELDEAGEFSEEDARKRDGHHGIKAIPVEVARACSSTHVRGERLRDAMVKLGAG